MADGHLPWLAQQPVLGSSAPETLFVLPAWAASLQLFQPMGYLCNPEFTYNKFSEFLEGSEAYPSPADFSDAGLGDLCSSPSSMVRTASQQPPTDGKEVQAVVLSQPKLIKDIQPKNEISMNCASATFDNSCTFSKMSLISNLLNNYLFWSSI